MSSVADVLAHARAPAAMRGSAVAVAEAHAQRAREPGERVAGAVELAEHGSAAQAQRGLVERDVEGAAVSARAAPARSAASSLASAISCGACWNA